MKFCDKLVKLRRKCNITQESLADKLDVSRQAVSKWESGLSYPDMSKMLQICKVLNCTLEDLMDDGAIKENGSSSNKNNFYNYIQDLLKFVTKTYNMICAMKFKEKIKCILEMCFIAFILFIVGCLIFVIMNTITNNLFSLIPYVIGSYLTNLFDSIYIIVLIILGVIIFIHLFKIRYLDYFITVEDDNVTEKTIEQPVESEKKYVEKDKERIIIRDPKHSTLSFFSGLAKLILVLIKVFLLVCAVPIVICFVGIVIFIVISLCHIPYSSLFIYISLILLGLGLINYAIIEIIYKFLVNRKQQLKKIFIIIIVGLIVFASGCGLSFVRFMKFENISNEDLKYKTETKFIDINDNTSIHGYLNYHNVDYEINNEIEQAKLEISYVDGFNYHLYYDEYYDSYYVEIDSDVWDVYEIVLEDIKDNKIRNYDISDLIKIKVYLNQNDYDIIKDNFFE